MTTQEVDVIHKRSENIALRGFPSFIQYLLHFFDEIICYIN